MKMSENSKIKQFVQSQPVLGHGSGIRVGQRSFLRGGLDVALPFQQMTNFKSMERGSYM